MVVVVVVVRGRGGDTSVAMLGHLNALVIGGTTVSIHSVVLNRVVVRTGGGH